VRLASRDAYFNERVLRREAAIPDWDEFEAWMDEVQEQLDSSKRQMRRRSRAAAARASHQAVLQGGRAQMRVLGSLMVVRRRRRRKRMMGEDCRMANDEWMAGLGQYSMLQWCAPVLHICKGSLGCLS
jgi:hypothetical protein